jgi:hypothetical protein
MAPRKHSYAIYGNVFEHRVSQYTGTSKEREILLKRYLVSTEFVQLWYEVLDGKFNQDIYSDLTDNEKMLLSRLTNVMHLPVSKEFNIAVSKFNKHLFERLRFIEAAIRSGNLSMELKVEYNQLIDKLVASGLIKSHLGSYNKTMMSNTPVSEHKKI